MRPWRGWEYDDVAVFMASMYLSSVALPCQHPLVGAPFISCRSWWRSSLALSLTRSTGSAPMGWNAWTFLLLLALVTLGRTGVFILGFKAFSSYYLMVQALINRNMMEYLLKAAGARMLPESPSEAVTRFRDDTEDIAKYVEHWMDLGGFVLYGLSAMAYLVSIDPMITLVACGPMFAMTLLMRRLAPLIRQYRRLFREKTALVTGFIGETFASVQAVQVSGKEEHMAAHFAKLGEELSQGRAPRHLVDGAHPHRQSKPRQYRRRRRVALGRGRDALRSVHGRRLCVVYRRVAPAHPNPHLYRKRHGAA